MTFDNLFALARAQEDFTALQRRIQMHPWRRFGGE